MDVVDFIDALTGWTESLKGKTIEVFMLPLAGQKILPAHVCPVPQTLFTRMKQYELSQETWRLFLKRQYWRAVYSIYSLMSLIERLGYQVSISPA